MNVVLYIASIGSASKGESVMQLYSSSNIGCLQKCSQIATEGQGSSSVGRMKMPQLDQVDRMEIDEEEKAKKEKNKKKKKKKKNKKRKKKKKKKKKKRQMDVLKDNQPKNLRP
ncbi:hypothetical protein QYF36_003045 [Acer negundo]|nr:hypothetical protein QYF36_003045 [Acer negundo]